MNNARACFGSAVLEQQIYVVGMIDHKVFNTYNF